MIFITQGFYLDQEGYEKSSAAQEWWKWYDSFSKSRKQNSAILAFIEIKNMFNCERKGVEADNDLNELTNKILTEFVNRYNPYKDLNFQGHLVHLLLINQEYASTTSFFEHNIIKTFIKWLEVPEEVQFRAFNSCLLMHEDVGMDNLYYYPTDALPFLDSIGVPLEDMEAMSTEDPSFAEEANLLTPFMKQFKQEYIKTLGKRGWISNTEYLMNKLE